MPNCNRDRISVYLNIGKNQTGEGEKTHGRMNSASEYTGFINCNSLYIIIGFHITSSRERESNLQAMAILYILYKLGSTICRTCDMLGVKTEFKSLVFKIPVHQHISTTKISEH